MTAKTNLLESKKLRAIFIVLFIAYIVLLLKLIIFRYPIPMMVSAFQTALSEPLSEKIMSVNLVPLKTISFYLAGKPSLGVARINLIGNIIAFVPFGFILPIIFKRLRSFILIFLLALLFILLLETIQLLTTVGAFDVDDITLNILGTVLGYIIFKIFTKMGKNKEEAA